MLNLLYRAARYILTPSPLNEGERDQPAPPAERVRHLEADLVKARMDARAEAARVAAILESRYSPANDQEKKER